MTIAMTDISGKFYWPAFIGLVGALVLTAALVTLFLIFKDQPIRLASLILLSALISIGAAYFACAAYILLTNWNGPVAETLARRRPVALNCKTAPSVNKTLVRVASERFYVPKYVGARGWLGLWLDLPKIDWKEVEDVITEAYRLVQ